MWKRELVPNKICAVLLVLCSLPMIFLDGDATATVFMSLIAFPMFFAKENWTMFKVPKGKEEQNTRRKYVQRELRELGIPRDAMAKLNFLMTMEDVATYIRDDFHKTADETTVYASLKIAVDGTDLHFLKVNSPCRVCKVTKQG